MDNWNRFSLSLAFSQAKSLTFQRPATQSSHRETRRLLCDWNKWLATCVDRSSKLSDCRPRVGNTARYEKNCRSFSLFDKFMLCEANDLLKRVNIFITFSLPIFVGEQKLSGLERNDFLSRKIPCQIEMPFRRWPSHWRVKIVSRFNWVSEKERVILRNYWITFTFVHASWGAFTKCFMKKCW